MPTPDAAPRGAPTQPPVSRRGVLLFSFAAFLLIGALQALYGPSFPLLRERFGIGPEWVSMAVSAQFLGSFVGIVFSSQLLRAAGYRGVLAGAAAALALGGVVVAAAPTWAFVLAGAFLAGAGAGLLNVACNLLVAVTFRPRAAPALNLINALFGVGAVVGPLLVTATEPRFALPFLVVAVAAALLLPWVARLGVPAVAGLGADAAPVAWGSLAGFVLLYVFYVSVEVGVTSWQTEFLTPHFGASAAAFTSLYWAAITVGRFAAAPISARLPSQRMVLYAAAATLVFMVASHRVPSAPIAFALVGLSLAPIFPTALAWLTEVFPQRADQVTPVVVAAANFGPAISAPLIGLFVRAEGPQVVPTVLSGLALLLLLIVTWLARRTRGRA